MLFPQQSALEIGVMSEEDKHTETQCRSTVCSEAASSMAAGILSTGKLQRRLYWQVGSGQTLKDLCIRKELELQLEGDIQHDQIMSQKDYSESQSYERWNQGEELVRMEKRNQLKSSIVRQEINNEG